MMVLQDAMPVKINEDLSREKKKNILFEARKLKRDKHIHSVYTRDCVIFEKRLFVSVASIVAHIEDLKKNQNSKSSIS